MTLRCIFGHRYARWGMIQEIPVWDSGLSLKPRALGNQPQTKQLYSDGKGGAVLRTEADIDYRLVGKVIEQRRVCDTCGYTQIDKQRWSV